MTTQSMAEQLSAALNGEDVEVQTGPEVMAEAPAEEAIAEVEEEGEDLLENETEAEIETLGQYIEAFEEDAEQFYNLKVDMPDGEEPTTLGGMKNDLTDARRTLKTTQDELANVTAQSQQYQQQSQQSAAIDEEVQEAQNLIMQIKGQYDSIDWLEAEAKSPGEAALGKQKFSEAMNEAKGKLQTAQSGAQGRQYQANIQVQQQSTQILQENIPGWRDPKVASAELNEVRQEWAKYYDPQYSGQITDPFHIMLTHEVLQLRKQLGKTETAIDTVRQSPRGGFRRGAGRKTPLAQRQAADLKVISRAKKTGSKNDVLAAQKAIVNQAGGI